MDERKEEQYFLKDAMKRFKEFFKFHLSKWWLVAVVLALGATLGLAYFKLQKPKYTATTTFILEDKSSGGPGLAGLASQFGFSMADMGSGGSIFAGDNVLEILKSKKVVERVLLSPVDSSGAATLADLYADFSGLRKQWQKKQGLSRVRFSQNNSSLSPIQDSLLNVIYQKIVQNNLYTQRTNKQGTIIKVDVVAGDMVFARSLTDRLVQEAGNLYLDLRVGTARENIQQLQRRSDSLLFLLNAKAYRAAASQPLDVNPGLRTAAVPVEIANRDKTVLSTLYAEVTKNLEASKVLLSQQTPVIQILDRPEYLLVDNRKSLMPLLIAGAFITTILYLFGSLLFFVFRRQ